MPTVAKPPKPSASPRPAAPATRSTGRQPDVALSPKLDEALAARLDEMVTRAVSTAMETALARGPAVHTDDRKDTKDYIDAAAAEIVGEERMEARRQAEARTRQEDARPWSLRPETGSSSVGARSNTLERSAPGVGLLAAEYLGWLTKADGDCERAHRMAKRGGASVAMQRALGESVFSAGGALVPQNIQADYIELLYNASVYLQAGPQRITVPNGNLTLPKITAGASVTWLGESQNITPSQQTTGQVRIDLRQQAVITPASNIFLRDSGPSAIEMIRNDLKMAAGVSLDATALRSLGTQWQPRGLRGWVPTANTFASTGSTVPLVTADIMHAFRLLEEAKHAMARVAVFSSPRTKWGLAGARDGNNNPVWAEELRQGTWYGAKFFSSQNIPNDVGTGGNKSEIYVVDMAQQIFAEDDAGIRVDVADGAAYYDGSAVVAGFSRDETVVRLIQRCDIVSRHGGTEIVEIYDVAVA